MVLTILTLSLAIGANASIFTVVDHVLVRSVPAPDADRLVRIYSSSPTAAKEIASMDDVADWRGDIVRFCSRPSAARPNLSAHWAPVVPRWLLRHPRFHLHFTPTYASWLYLVERFFGMLTEKALRRGSHTSVAALREAILAYVAAHNDRDKPFQWTRTADEILDKIRRFGLRTQRAHAQ